ncbi:DNA mismatch repair protein MutS [Paramesorhizobium deserti]|uniref:DNA mismatch repair protein MutS n=1 Tax=Paramesorhizobium deserti TaxID=1494590 RepID=A0A135I1C5_9HYPH|nr:Smr/MutS family protein [Paramesorhizobium deserti]KXF79240.1 DNA mismatch repair protein MutS [Paramesorhizobium deserti]
MTPRDKPPKAATDGPQSPERDRLRLEDRILWETVARTARPLKPQRRKRPELPDDFDLWEAEIGAREPLSPKAEKAASSGPPVQPKPLGKPREPHPLHPLDRTTHRKIAKGRLDIDARIDLHGLTQREAHNLLYGFLLDARSRGLRHVLVITGKGSSSGSEGILRQAVPHWFSTPAFRILVSAYEDAARKHGGHGALYVRLRRTGLGDLGVKEP